MRLLIVILTIIFGILLRGNWSIAMSFIGSIGSSVLAFICPGLFSLRLLKK